MFDITLVAALAFGYLLGSIPFGLLLTRAAGLGDIRAIGSGNIGATNVLRTGNKKLAAATLLLDGLKGTAAVLIAQRWGMDFGLVAGLGAFLGHVFPVWLRFQGGKGVATFIGILLAVYWPAFLAFALIWVVMAYAFRFSSLAALSASLSMPALFFATGQRGLALSAVVAMVFLLFAKHHQNIAKLIAGTESRIGEKSAPPPP
ncbi:glycerol-3-phosphate 1-O-acyltransferase PlsY [Phreatobacter aquaticus]|uniref:Glycerol-3-phosphate acyltransferase n=1 Tax=Phreatobacter aquaticus TaxID=2570229 RepID=A0A4D7QM93_9HYPH|nr:glycerol-3-phosphate 1-O-acyltransferase PlsY [Phreatobacter aquaticus]QCK87641.1 glycerol-3-phosphate 1-O-acyltransferase PlsY [Phreatobacter aquaticus]